MIRDGICAFVNVRHVGQINSLYLSFRVTCTQVLCNETSLAFLSFNLRCLPFSSLNILPKIAKIRNRN